MKDVLLTALLTVAMVVVSSSAMLIALVTPLQKIEIIYFTTSDLSTPNIDKMIDAIEERFGERLVVYRIIVRDSEDERESVRLLMRTYGVRSIPTIIINGERFEGEYTMQNLVYKICEKFLIKPDACFG